jgi:hypothetical protein
MRQDDRPTETIEAEIARTRADIDATLSAIQDRLTPGQLVDQGLDYLRHSGANEFVSNLGNSVKYNPLPVTLVGIGIAWLMVSGNRPARASGETLEAEGAATRLRERAGETMSRVSEAAGSARETMAGSAQAARESFSHAQKRASERAKRIAEGARHQIERARGGYEYMVHEQPLALGAIGLAVGAAIAAAVPRTRTEDQWMGEARDRLAEKAKDAGREQLHKAERVAAAAGSAAGEEAGRQGSAKQAGFGNRTAGLDRPLPASGVAEMGSKSSEPPAGC